MTAYVAFRKNWLRDQRHQSIDPLAVTAELIIRKWADTLASHLHGSVKQ